MIRRLIVKITTFAMIIAATILVTGKPAAAGPPRYQPPDLVAIGDSFAAGTGNTPYIGPPQCGRSANDAYSQRLDQLRLVSLQAFPACGGAKTTDVIAQGQLNAITEDTDIVTVQAFGNDVMFSTLASICLGDDCSLDGKNAAIVRAILAGIGVAAQDRLDPFYRAIRERVDTKNPQARVLVVDYGNPLPPAGAPIGFFCEGLLTPGETEVAQQFADGINKELAKAAATYGFVYIDAAPRFRGLDICGFATAFFRPAGPGSPPVDPRGVIHPNKFGQGIYAAVLAGHLH